VATTVVAFVVSCGFTSVWVVACVVPLDWLSLLDLDSSDVDDFDLSLRDVVLLLLVLSTLLLLCDDGVVVVVEESSDRRGGCDADWVVLDGSGWGLSLLAAALLSTSVAKLLLSDCEAGSCLADRWAAAWNDRLANVSDVTLTTATLAMRLPACCQQGPGQSGYEKIPNYFKLLLLGCSDRTRFPAVSFLPGGKIYPLSTVPPRFRVIASPEYGLY